MSQRLNELGQPIGVAINGWSPCQSPPLLPMPGRYCRLEILQPALHAKALYEAFVQDKNHANWTYLPYGPFDDFEAFNNWLTPQSQQSDPLFHAVIDLSTGQAVGLASYLRIEPTVGVIEVGHIHFSPLMQRTPLATEAMFLMMRRVFDELGYRRYEWKCDALNEPSKHAAKRLGFQFEGIFRQATIYKNRNRDTAWLSVIDSEWPRLRSSFEQWLAPENFDENGQQRQSLSEFRSV